MILTDEDLVPIIEKLGITVYGPAAEAVEALAKLVEAAVLEKLGKQEPDSNKVICPNCCHQFRAIPVNVQKLMLDAGFEPPFTEAPVQKQRQPLTDDQVEIITNDAFEESAFMGTRAMSSTVVRMVERHHGIGVEK